MTPRALDHVTTRAKRQWDQTHSRGPIARLFRSLGAMKSASAVWICRHASGDWDGAHCRGEVVQAWRYDGSGLAQVEHLPELDHLNAIASATPVISFCLNETGDRMIYQEWNGPRAGFGAILALKGTGSWCTEKHAWVS